jgi:hypothetical protein
MKQFLVFDVGCIECGESSSVVGVFPTEAAARFAYDAYFEKGTTWGKAAWHGEHHVNIWPVEIEIQ